MERQIRLVFLPGALVFRGPTLFLQLHLCLSYKLPTKLELYHVTPSFPRQKMAGVECSSALAENIGGRLRTNEPTPGDELLFPLLFLTQVEDQLHFEYCSHSLALDISFSSLLLLQDVRKYRTEERPAALVFAPVHRFFLVFQRLYL